MKNKILVCMYSSPSCRKEFPDFFVCGVIFKSASCQFVYYIGRWIRWLEQVKANCQERLKITCDRQHLSAHDLLMTSVLCLSFFNFDCSDHSLSLPF